jgi:6-phosphogluconolactonase (cycloisomerase 2 family)
MATGHHPISVTVDYSGKFLYAVSDTDSSVTTYTIDPTTGGLTVASTATPGGTPKGLAISRTVEMH